MSTINPPHRVAHFVAERAAPAAIVLSFGAFMTAPVASLGAAVLLLLSRGRYMKPHLWLDQPRVGRQVDKLMTTSAVTCVTAFAVKGLAETAQTHQRLK